MRGVRRRISGIVAGLAVMTAALTGGNGVAGQPAAAALPGGGAVHAIFIGISRYQHMDKLAFCASDAVRLARVFQGLDGDLRLAPAHTVVLTDSQATRARVLRELAAVRQRLGPRDVFLFYFSGHGGGEDEPDMPPVDEPDDHDETLVMWDSRGPHEEDISDDQLRVILAGFPGRQVIILDACYAGGFVRDLERPGTVVFAASREDRTSSVAFAHRASGGLTHALMTGLAGEADADTDRVIGQDELVAYLGRVVPLYCEDCGRRNPPGANRCYYCRVKVATAAHRPTFGGAWPELVWSRVTVAYVPERCHSAADRRGCAARPSRCRCRVKGECGVAACQALGRKIIDGCSSAEDRATCRSDAQLCPCPEYGNCGMGECAAPAGNSCRTGEDRRQCGEDPRNCPCGHYGDCEMDSCREARTGKESRSEALSGCEGAGDGPVAGCGDCSPGGAPEPDAAEESGCGCCGD